MRLRWLAGACGYEQEPERLLGSPQAGDAHLEEGQTQWLCTSEAAGGVGKERHGICLAAECSECTRCRHGTACCYDVYSTWSHTALGGTRDKIYGRLVRGVIRRIVPCVVCCMVYAWCMPAACCMHVVCMLHGACMSYVACRMASVACCNVACSCFMGVGCVDIQPAGPRRHRRIVPGAHRRHVHVHLRLNTADRPTGSERVSGRHSGRSYVRTACVLPSGLVHAAAIVPRTVLQQCRTVLRLSCTVLCRAP